MVLNETLTYVLPEAIVARFGTVITIIQAVGIALLFYIGFSIVNTILNRKRVKEFRKMNQNLEEIKAILQRKKIS